ncbi:hypothetical protein D3C76_775440 [compost metagenome]
MIVGLGQALQRWSAEIKSSYDLPIEFVVLQAGNQLTGTTDISGREALHAAKRVIGEIRLKQHWAQFVCTTVALGQRLVQAGLLKTAKRIVFVDLNLPQYIDVAAHAAAVAVAVMHGVLFSPHITVFAFYIAVAEIDPFDFMARFIECHQAAVFRIVCVVGIDTRQLPVGRFFAQGRQIIVEHPFFTRCDHQAGLTLPWFVLEFLITVTGDGMGSPAKAIECLLTQQH